MKVDLKNKEEIEILVSYYNNKIYAIDENIHLLEKERLEIKMRISEILTAYENERDIDKSPLFVPVYQRDWTVVKKTEYILTNVERIVLSTREITEHINVLEGGGFNESQKRDWISKLGATLKQKTDKDEIFGRAESDNGEYYYGLRDWFYENGKVRISYINTRFHPKVRADEREDMETRN